MNTGRLRICAGLGLGLAVVCTPPVALAGSITVSPGESIQAAVDAASAKDTIYVLPGTYHEPALTGPAVHVTKALKLIAKISKAEREAGAKAIIEAMPGQTDGVLAEGPDASNPILGFQIKGFTIQGFPNNGIFLRYVDGFKIEGNESINNLENGIWPTLSANGLVKRNVAYGSEDSSLWVEASENVRVLNNEFYGSPTGLEVTVSNNVFMKGNDVHDNTVGVGFYHPNAASLPPLATMADWTFKGNHVYNNNMPNNAPPGTMSAALPAGGGVLVMGTDYGTFDKNVIQNNDFYGVAVIDYCTAVAGGDFDCTANPPIVDEYPDVNKFRGNTMTGNGTNPDPSHPLADYAADITYIMFDAGHYNCFAKNNEYDTREYVVGIGYPPSWNGQTCK